jgi:hypothetical protein
MRNAMGSGVNGRESGRNQYAGDEAQPIGAVRMSESTRASPLVPPALARGVLRGLRGIARGWRAWEAAYCARLACAHTRNVLRAPPPRIARQFGHFWKYTIFGWSCGEFTPLRSTHIT